MFVVEVQLSAIRLCAFLGVTIRPSFNKYFRESVLNQIHWPGAKLLDCSCQSKQTAVRVGHILLLISTNISQNV